MPTTMYAHHGDRLSSRSSPNQSQQYFFIIGIPLIGLAITSVSLWWCFKRPKHVKERHELEAREGRIVTLYTGIGVWKDPKRVAPWDWRNIELVLGDEWDTRKARYWRGNVHGRFVFWVIGVDDYAYMCISSDVKDIGVVLDIKPSNKSQLQEFWMDL